MSVLTYNGVLLPYVTVTSFRQDVLYDESNTDWYLLKFDIQVQCVISQDYLASLAPTLIGVAGTDSPAALMKVLRGRLMRSRRQLQFQVGGVDLIPTPVGLGTVDAKNGPQPQGCVLLQLNSSTFLMNYHIVAHYWESYSQLGVDVTQPTPAQTTNLAGNNVLYNRWSESVDIDTNNYSVRTRNGKFVIRSDNPDGLVADQLRRQAAVVGVPKGCLRETATYRVSPDGLGIEYTLRDREVFKLPPAPAFTAQGTYTERTTKGFGQRLASCHVRLTGDKKTDQAKLIRVAIDVVTSKLLSKSAAIAQNFAVITEAALTVGMYDNWVDFACSAMMPGTGGRVGQLAGFAAFDTLVRLSDPGAGGDPNYSPAYLDRGTLGLLLECAAYYDPSLRNTHINIQTGRQSAGAQPGQFGKTRES